MIIIHNNEEYVAVGDCTLFLAQTLRMAVLMEMQNTGSAEVQREVSAIVEHVFAERPGEWRVSIVGSQDSDRWKLKIVGPRLRVQTANMGLR